MATTPFKPESEPENKYTEASATMSAERMALQVFKILAKNNADIIHEAFDSRKSAVDGLSRFVKNDDRMVDAYASFPVGDSRYT